MNDLREQRRENAAYELPPGTFLKRMKQLGFMVIMQVGLVFLSAWDIQWTRGWIYAGLLAGSIMINSIVLLRVNPGIIKARSETTGTKDWDTILAGVMAFILYVPFLVTAGLDHRFGWMAALSHDRSLSMTFLIMGIALFLMGAAVTLWAMASNRYFSGTVRIQKEDGHSVQRGGPYAYVRHPGYVGMILTTFGNALFLDSLWSLIPAGVGLALLVVRTALEDKTLHEELPGYREYAEEVSYRLLPGVW